MTWMYPPGLGATRLAKLGLSLRQGPDTTEVDIFQLVDISTHRAVALPAHQCKGMDFPRFVMRPNMPSVLLAAVRWLEANNQRPEVLPK